MTTPNAPPPSPPRDINDAIKDLTMTEEEAAALEAKSRGEEEEPKPGDLDHPDAPDPSAAPPFVTFPDGFKIPPHKELTFLLFRKEWMEKKTVTVPGLSPGDRWCMMWPLTDAEEKLAAKRCRDNSLRLIDEMSKQTIRIIDGKRVDWSGAQPEGLVSISKFWDEVGPKCRKAIQTVYLQTHQLTGDELADFFTKCLFVRRQAG